ncbi:MAG: GumC family protein [bacterium]
MNNNESQQIFNQINKIFKRRKLLILFCILGVIAPIIYFNETSAPVFESRTMVVFEEFTGTLSSYGYDASREILIFNRLEEIKSLAFAEDVANTLSEEIIDKIKLPAERPADFDKFQYISEKIEKNISAFPVSKSNIVRISVQWTDPYIAMVLANTAANVLLERNYKIRQEGVSSVRKFVEEQLLRVRSELNASEQALKKFKEQNRITSFNRESEEILKRLTEAEVLYNQVKGNKGSIERRLAAIQDKLAKQKQNIVPSITDIASPYTQKLKDKLVNLQSELAGLKVQGYESTHSKIIQLNRDIEQTKKTLAIEAKKLVQYGNISDPLLQIEKYLNDSFTLQIELEALKAQEVALKKIMDDYDKRLGSLPNKEFNLLKLTRERDVNNNIYLSLMEKLEEAKISEAEKVTNIRIIDNARIPISPIKPRKKLNITIGVLLGFILGTGLAFVLEVSNKTWDSTEELEKLTQWNVLASIPKIEKIASNGKTSVSNGKVKHEAYVKRGIISSIDPKSGVAEAFRMLRTNLQFQGVGQSCKTILFTSIGPSEGKSTTVANLAISLANLGENVLVVDSDLRKPILHTIFGIDKEPGLSELLVNHSTINEELTTLDEQKSVLGDVVNREEMGELVDNFSEFVLDSQFVAKIDDLKNMNSHNILNSTLVETIQISEVGNLKILSSGKQLKNPSETISSLSMRTLIDELKQRFSVILIDSAPIMLVPETMVLSALVDGVIFVVDSKKFNEEMLLKAKGLLEKANARVLGTVLNNVELNGIYKNNYYYYDA